MPNKTFVSRDRRTGRLLPSKLDTRKPFWLKCVLHNIHKSAGPRSLSDFSPDYGKNLTRPLPDSGIKRKIKPLRSRDGKSNLLLTFKCGPKKLASLSDAGPGPGATKSPPSSSGVPPQHAPTPQSPTTKTLEKLPNELKSLVFCKSPDIHTARALAATSTTYREVYKADERRILSDILCRDPRLFGEAVAVHEAAKLDYDYPFKDYDVERHLDSYIKGRFDEVRSNELSLEDLRTMADLQENIDFLAKQYYQSRLARNAVHDGSEANCQPSNSELKRLYSAFYMLQHFCYLFKHLPDTYHDRDLSKFFAIYPAYEVESLVCVKEYLHERIDEIVKTVRGKLSDYSTGKEMPPILRAVNPCYRGRRPLHLGPLHVEDLPRVLRFYDYPPEAHDTRLALGLSYLCRLLTANPETAMELLTINDRGVSQEFLSTALKEDSYSLLFDHELREAFYHQDDDPYGPAGWAWANGGKVELRYNRVSRKEIRAWGYPFWDQDRLEKWGVLQVDSSKYQERDRENMSGNILYYVFDRHSEYCRRIDDEQLESFVSGDTFNTGDDTSTASVCDSADDMEWESDSDSSCDSDIEDAYTAQSPPPTPRVAKRKFCDEEEVEPQPTTSQSAFEDQGRRKARRIDREGGPTILGANGGEGSLPEKGADDQPSTPEQESNAKTTHEAESPRENRSDYQHRRGREDGYSLRGAEAYMEKLLEQQRQGLARGSRQDTLFLLEQIKRKLEDEEAEERLRYYPRTDFDASE